MHKIYYQPEGVWFGDCMPFGKGNEFYLFHQRDNRNPCPFGEPFGWSLATTSDFVHYEDHSIAIPRGADDEQDQFIYAGSIFQDREGGYHAFYTGYNRDFIKQDRPSQVIMHAVSDDLLTWTKTGDALELAPQEGYDKDDWRDPFVMWDEEEQEYLLILGGRKINGKKLLNGCSVYFTSKDCRKWTFRGDFWTPNIFTMHEMQDIFKIGDWWYLLISEYSDRKKIVYRMSKSLKGPWTAPVDDAFDGRAYYAGRTYCLNGQRILFGWVPTRDHDDDRANYLWAGAFMPHEIYQREDGSLGVKIPDSVWNAFCERKAVQNIKLATVDTREERILAEDCGDLFSLEMTVTFKENTRSFALKLYEDPETGEAYQYIFSIGEKRIYFEKSPNFPWFQYMNMGLERPVDFTPNTQYHIRLIVDDTIATLYINGVALNVRMYHKFGDAVGIFVQDGTAEFTNISIARGIQV